MDDKITDQNDHGSNANEETSRKDKHRVEEKYPFRKRLSSFRTFLTHFYVEQKENPFQSLIGPGPNNSETFWLTHLWYIFILSFIPVCGLLSTVGFIQPYLASDNSLCDWKRERQSCQNVIVVFITYRIGFSVTIFFLFTALLLSKRKSRDLKQDGVSTLHTGFWIEKVILVLVLSCVAFAFPPVIFDAVWIYIALIGDVILTCVMLFLLCDFIIYINQKILAWIIQKKWENENGALELFNCTLSLLIIISLMLASVYTIQGMQKSLYLTAYITVLTLYLTAQLIYVRFERSKLLVPSLFASAFINMLMWIFIMNYKQYTEPSSDSQGVWAPSNTIMLLTMYTLIVFAVTRRDERTYFYYFYWTVCAGDIVERSLDQPRYTDSVDNFKRNSNETLIDCSPNDISESSCYDIVYNESFIHLFLCLVSLKSTVVITNYSVLTVDQIDLRANKTLQSTISLFVTSLLVIILYTGYLMRSKLESIHSNDPLSVGLLLKSIFQWLSCYASKFLFGKPKCLSRSSRGRYVYLVFLLFCFVLACFIISPPFKHLFQRISIFCDHVSSFGVCMSHDPTFNSLYRIFATVAIFFGIIGTMTISITPFKRIRHDIQNGCWPVKLILLFAIFASVVNLPNKLSRYWLYFDMVSILIFTLLQLFCLIDAIVIASNALRKDSVSEISKSSLGITFLLYAISIIAYVSFYVFYAHNYKCSVTRFFVSINLVLCLSASLISIHPDVKNGSLLLSAVVTSFCMYTTWAALNYNPEEKCNPLAHTLMLVEARPGRDAVSVTDLFFLFVSLVYFIIRVEDIFRRAYDLSLGLLLDKIFKYEFTEDILNQKTECKEKVEQWLSSQNQQISNLSSVDVMNDVTNYSKDELDSRTKSDDEEDDWCYTSVHFICSMACSYAFLLLAHWLEPVPGSGFKVSLHWAIMSVKLISSSVCVLLYIWILVMPVIRKKIAKNIT